MPTSTFSIAANADDGGAYQTATAVINNTFNYARVDYVVSPYLKAGGWLRFTGITIPQNSTVNSATLKTYVVSGFNGTSITVALDSQQSPGNPTIAASVLNPSLIRTPVTMTGISTYGTPSLKAAYVLNNLSVTAAVQAQVNAYNLSNGEMLFYCNTTLNKQVYIYNRDWGTTKDAELVIDYTPSARRKTIITEVD